ncbi:chromosome segregation protein SMC [Alkalibacter mobilis]|uniref:chromosome segregation protein SMC n=1 Tax=Alkalibacter mobilis TaxID=2787712 RepID=UPI0018A0EF04|nr:chromosome segregation protein SMC [Alkalibacter mobilis]MBF7095835.1 chromosome segregation protein SMC [Alkalibacter mobilis]
MHLKKIEIYGFKSFADKIELDFDKGITAVVGPNGSGKSNISDAIKWVLGEQKVKSLRGTKMEDVIFAGTVARKQLGYAEVTLILDNSDKNMDLEFDEVSVTRRLYRSGDSEYLINKVQCRLKDVQDLFADTGLGKEGYSIIGQGKIDSIVSSNPQDIRHLFDEAAGIVKFKNRKIESERKLERTVDNIHRVTDIVAELEKQLGPLKRQRKKAQDYLEIADELKKIDLNVFVYKTDRLNKIIRDFENDRDDGLENQNYKNAEIQAADERYQTLRRDIGKIDMDMADLNDRLLQISQSAEKFNTEIQVSVTNISNSKSSITQLEEEKAETFLNNERLLESMDKILLAIKDTLNKLDILKAKIESLEESKKDYEESIVQIKNSNILSQDKNRDLNEKYNIKRNEILKLERETEFAAEKIRDLETAKDTLKDKEKIFNEDLLESLKKLEILEESLVKSESEKIDQNEEILQIKESKESKLLHKSTILNNIASQKSKLHMLQEDQDIKGYYKSVKNLLSYKEKDDYFRTNIHDITGNLLDVDEKYSVAVETALGGAFQNIVVQDDECAKKAIKLLNKFNWGRATFLPIDTVRGNKDVLPESVKSLPGVIGLAVDIVQFDKKYENIFNNLLGRTLIVESMESASQVRQKFNHKSKIVTLEGEVFYPGGAIVGGSFNKNNLLLQRSQRITALKNEIRNYGLEIKEIDDELNVLDNELADRTQYFDRILKDVNEKSIEKKLLEQKISNIKSELHENHKKIEEYANTMHSIRELLLTADTEKVCLMNHLTSLKKEMEISEKEVDSSELEKLESELGRINEMLNESKMERVKLDTELTNLNQRQEEMEITITEQKNLIEKKDNQIKCHKEKIIELENTIKVRTESMVSSEEKKNEVKNELKEMQEMRHDLNSEFDSLERKLKDLNHEMALINESLGKLDLKINSNTIEKEHLSESIFENYQMTYLMAKEYSYPVEDMDAEIKKVRELKDRIKSLGNINLAAIEQYTEVKERFEFLTEQKEDLLAARDELKSLIKNISKDIEIQFVEQFSLIQSQFNQTFKKLFNGGNAGLLIIDDEDIMDTGIEIVAQPPGKKLKNITLLSGGEKALTAIALLFAIISIKPAPFCVLDEIDAALDDSNVDRFAEFLSVINKQNQFITITHRKGTMEIADRLYGITMGKDGVSKMLSVQISDII